MAGCRLVGDVDRFELILSEVKRLAVRESSPIRRPFARASFQQRAAAAFDSHNRWLRTVKPFVACEHEILRQIAVGA